MTLRNIIWFIVLAVFSLGYFHTIGASIPSVIATEINLLLVPAFVGFICFFVFSGKVLVKLGITCLLPIIWEISVCCEWEKLFLDLMGVVAVMLFVFLGFGMAYFVHEKFSNIPITDS